MGLRRSRHHSPGAAADEAALDPWLEAFHRGERGALEACYREHFDTVDGAAGAILRGADRETVVHEVFSRLIARAELRRAFRGGSFAAWLATVARNHAIDYRRRLARETSLSDDARGGAESASWEEAAQARLLVERFRRESLPAEWAPVFELCFVQQMSQREAAQALGISRTTLAYREMRIRRELRRFVLEADEPEEGPT
jgi:RNA polymerase sigma-70 factor (ECF subfamily)